MANRKAAAARKKHERRLLQRKYTLYYTVALAFSVAVAVLLLLTVFFKTTVIEVHAENIHHSKDEIVDVSGIRVGDNLLRIDTQKASRTVLSTLPYAAEVIITRRFPETVVIQVRWSEPVEALFTGGGYQLVSDQGRVLETDLPLRPEGYPFVFGFEGAQQLKAGEYLPKEQKKNYELLRQITASLSGENFSGIDVIDLRDLLNIRMLYRGRIDVELGSRLEIEYKIRLAKATLDLEENRDLVGVLDVSSRPMARLRAVDIYRTDTWPFPMPILDEFERKVTTQNIFSR